MSHDLAQVNIGRRRGPVDSAVLREFKAGLDPRSARAEASPGSVGCLTGDTGDATELWPYPEARMFVNLAVWASLGARRACAHADFFRRRREGFERLEGSRLARCWRPAGTRPTPAAAQARRGHRDAPGQAPHALTFRPLDPAPA